MGKPLPIQEIGYPSLDSLVQRLVANKVIRQEVKGKGEYQIRVHTEKGNPENGNGQASHGM